MREVCGGRGSASSGSGVDSEKQDSRHQCKLVYMYMHTRTCTCICTFVCTCVYMYMYMYCTCLDVHVHCMHDTYMYMLYTLYHNAHVLHFTQCALSYCKYTYMYTCTCSTTVYAQYTCTVYSMQQKVIVGT